jgi:hypothetical protein
MTLSAKLAIGALLVLFVGVLIYSSLGLGRVTVEVCVEFKGQTNCGTAAAPESIVCSRTTPKSIRRLSD